MWMTSKLMMRKTQTLAPSQIGTIEEEGVEEEVDNNSRWHVPDPTRTKRESPNHLKNHKRSTIKQ